MPDVRDMIDAPEPEGFARRWSRLKRQQESVPVAAAEPAEPPVELPPPAETVALADVTQWLSRPLPEGWRETVLRRVWSADPAIRDFKGLADYAWDWSTPGGAPGWGPLDAADDIARLLARAIGEVAAPSVPEPALPVPPRPEPAVEIVPAAPEGIEPPDGTFLAEPVIGFRRRGGGATPV